MAELLHWITLNCTGVPDKMAPDFTIVMAAHANTARADATVSRSLKLCYIFVLLLKCILLMKEKNTHQHQKRKHRDWIKRSIPSDECHMWCDHPRKRGKRAGVRAKITQIGPKATLLLSLLLANVWLQAQANPAKGNQRLLCPHGSITTPLIKLLHTMGGPCSTATKCKTPVRQLEADSVFTSMTLGAQM